MRETLLLLRLRWRHTQEGLIYWVRSGLYYDPRKRTTGLDGPGLCTSS